MAIRPVKMKRQEIGILAVLALVAASPATAFIPGLKRTLPGRIWRFAFGSPGATQWTEDLVDDVRAMPEPQRLRQWSQELMDAYATGNLVTDSAPQYWSSGQVLVPEERIPAWIPSSLRKPAFGLPPEVTILLKQDGTPRYVVYGWYLKGLIIFGDQNEEIQLSPFCIKEAVPGIYAYSLEK